MSTAVAPPLDPSAPSTDGWLRTREMYLGGELVEVVELVGDEIVEEYDRATITEPTARDRRPMATMFAEPARRADLLRALADHVDPSRPPGGRREPSARHADVAHLIAYSGRRSGPGRPPSRSTRSSTLRSGSISPSGAPNTMGAKARLVDGSWWVFTNYRRQRRAKKLGAVTREVAHQVAADINLKLAREDYKLPPKRGTALRFAELAQEWIATYPAVRTLAANTRNNYEWFIREHLIPYFGNMAVTDIDYQTVEAFIALKRSPKGSTRYTGQPIGDHSLRVGVVTLAMILDRAIKVHKLITVNPARGVARFTRPADDDRVDPFTPEELRLILSAAVATDFELATFLRVWMQTGLRLGEVCGLQHQDLDLRRGLVLVRRTYN